MPYTLNAFGLFDFIYATPADDQIVGYPGEKNELHGLNGNDVLIGDDRKDKIYGGDGQDSLYGGRGVDKLWGGAGADFFHYEYPRDGRDKIKDFVPGEDQIVIWTTLGFSRGREGIEFNPDTRQLTYEDDSGKVKVLATFHTAILDVDRDVAFFT